MIYYIATYPHSGNSWLQGLIANQLGRLPTNVHSESVDQFLTVGFKMSFPTDTTLDEVSITNDLNNLFYTYQNPYEPTAHYRALRSGFGTIWNDTLRQQLAEMDEVFFIKTHEKPYPSYFPGEYVIQIIRHPGACLWSYYHFLRDIENVYHHTLTDLIRGEVGFGCWSAYHQAWNEMIPHLDNKFLRVKYEQLAGHELAFCQRLAAFTQLPILSQEIKTFEHHQQRNPKFFRYGEASNWKNHYSQEQKDLLWQQHGQMMSLLDYPAMVIAKKAKSQPPTFSIASVVEQPKTQTNLALIIKQSSILQQVQAGHTQEAINTLTQLLETQSNNALVHNDLGVLLFMSTELTTQQQALKHLEYSLSLNPIDSDILENVVKVYHLLGKNQEATNALAMALTRSSDSTLISKVAALYALLGHDKQAKQLQNTIPQQQPATVTEQSKITLTLAQPTTLQAVQAGQVNEVITQLNRLLQTQPNHALNHNDLGALLFAQEGTRTQGFTHLKMAVSLQPDNVILVKNLARVHTLFKHNDDAKQLWENLLRLKPDDTEAKEALAQFITIELPIFTTASPKNEKSKSKKHKKKR